MDCRVLKQSKMFWPRGKPALPPVPLQVNPWQGNISSWETYSRCHLNWSVMKVGCFFSPATCFPLLPGNLSGSSALLIITHKFSDLVLFDVEKVSSYFFLESIRNFKEKAQMHPVLTTGATLTALTNSAKSWDHLESGTSGGGGGGGVVGVVAACHTRSTALQLSAIWMGFQDSWPKLSPHCLRSLLPGRCSLFAVSHTQSWWRGSQSRNASGRRLWQYTL